MLILKLSPNFFRDLQELLLSPMDVCREDSSSLIYEKSSFYESISDIGSVIDEKKEVNPLDFGR
jgi:hypothetical protein